ncbi:MAG TPA: M28 family metallopeptidase [Bryobacteraceae bacterium]|nr:M28 family metallopeptidase [Bryobacteraceae bacterium]
MTSYKIRYLAAGFAGLLAAYAATDFGTEGNRWWSHIEYLASDAMEGRGLGTEGFRKASEYVAGEFQKAGLKSAGTSGYFQTIDFNVREIDEPHSSVSLVRGGKAEKVELGKEANISLRGEPMNDVDAGAVFVGYGLTAPEAKYDDLAGQNLKGKIAVYFAAGPKNIPGPLSSHYQRERWKYLKAAGVVGTATIQNPKAMDIPWERSTLARFRPVISLADPAMNESAGDNFGLTINPAEAEKFFAGSGHTFAELLSDLENNKPMPHFALPYSFKAHVAFKQTKTQSRNTVGIYEGSDPKLKNEYVAMSAHLDHIGIGKPINGDAIYNGAMDDASGVASVIEVANLLRESGAKTKRSVLLVVVTGEESGLLGSRYFATHPTVPAGSIVADINLDMFLPLHALHSLEVQGVQESTLGNDIRAVAAANGVGVQTDKEPQRNLFIRSDQYSFIRQGVPALAFKFGYEFGSPEEKLHKDWLKERYHAPSDDLKQPVDKAAAGKFNIVIEQLIERVANANSRPQWNGDSFFRRFKT